MDIRKEVRVWIWPSIPLSKFNSALLLSGLLIATGLTTPASGQTPKYSSSPATDGAGLQQEVRLLRSEVEELRAELNTLKQTVQQQNRPSGPPLADSTPPGAVAEIPAVPEAAAASSPVQAMLQSQVAELAQTKVESSSKMPIKIYGTILSTTFFNSRAVDWADEPVRVNPPSQVTSNTGGFSSSLRQSRIGLLVDGPTIGAFKTNAVFALDFNGGQTDFLSSPSFGLANIVYGYVRMDNGRTAIEAGQDELILASRNPTSLVAFSYPELYRAGNLYTRAPQLRLEQKLINSSQGVLKLTAGLVAPVGTYPPFDNPNPAAPPSLGWQRPAIQERLSWQSPSLAEGNDSGFELGAAGHYGRVGLPGLSAASWAGSFDFNVRQGKVGFDGRGFIGQNLEDFGGGIGQPGKTMGGYLESRFIPTKLLQFNAGFGTDHLTKLDVIPVSFQRNSAVYANTIYQFTPELGASLEYRYMFTQPFNGTLNHNSNVDLGIAFSF